MWLWIIAMSRIKTKSLNSTTIFIVMIIEIMTFAKARPYHKCDKAYISHDNEDNNDACEWIFYRVRFDPSVDKSYQNCNDTIWWYKEFSSFNIIFLIFFLLPPPRGLARKCIAFRVPKLNNIKLRNRENWWLLNAKKRILIIQQIPLKNIAQ